LERLADYVAVLWRSGEFWWVAFGFGAQAVFFLRFFVQWLASEREKKSVIPNAFWYISLVGGLMLFAYAVHKRDPVFIAGQAFGVFIYLRNIIFIHGERGKEFAFVVIILLIGVTLFLVDTGRTALSASSEARASEIAREMYATGDYVVPHLDGRIALTKPPLYHWLTALSFRLFGVNEVAARLVSSIAGILTLFAAYLLGRKMFDPTVGFLAAVVTASSIEFTWNARAARTDMLYTFFAVAAIAAFVYAAESARGRRRLYILSFALMGLAFMTKGPAGLFIPLVSGVGYLWLTGRKADVRAIPWAGAAAVFIVITAPWHVAVSLSVPAQDRYYFFLGQIARWAAGQGEEGGSPPLLSFFVYVPLLVGGFFPWSFFLPAGLVASWKAFRSGRNRRLALPFVWFVIGLVAFSLSGTRAIRYIIPMFPAGAIMVAFLWREAFASGDGAGSDPFARKANRWLKASLWPLVVTSVAVSAFVAGTPAVIGSLKSRGVIERVLNEADAFGTDVWSGFVAAHPAAFTTVAAAFALAAVGALVAAYKARVAYAFGLLTVVVLGFLCLFEFVTLPKIDEINNVKPFVRHVRVLVDFPMCLRPWSSLSIEGKAAVLARPCSYAWVGNASLETLFYMGGYYDTVGPGGVKAYFERNPQGVVLAWNRDYERLPEDDRRFARVVFTGRMKHRIAVVLASSEAPARVSGAR